MQGRTCSQVAKQVADIVERHWVELGCSMEAPELTSHEVDENTLPVLKEYYAGGPNESAKNGATIELVRRIDGIVRPTIEKTKDNEFLPVLQRFMKATRNPKHPCHDWKRTHTTSRRYRSAEHYSANQIHFALWATLLINGLRVFAGPRRRDSTWYVAASAIMFVVFFVGDEDASENAKWFADVFRIMGPWIALMEFEWLKCSSIRGALSMFGIVKGAPQLRDGQVLITGLPPNEIDELFIYETIEEPGSGRRTTVHRLADEREDSIVAKPVSAKVKEIYDEMAKSVEDTATEGGVAALAMNSARKEARLLVHANTLRFKSLKSPFDSGMSILDKFLAIYGYAGAIAEKVYRTQAEYAFWWVFHFLYLTCFVPQIRVFLKRGLSPLGRLYDVVFPTPDMIASHPSAEPLSAGLAFLKTPDPRDVYWKLVGFLVVSTVVAVALAEGVDRFSAVKTPATKKPADGAMKKPADGATKKPAGKSAGDAESSDEDGPDDTTRRILSKAMDVLLSLKNKKSTDVKKTPNTPPSLQARLDWIRDTLVRQKTYPLDHFKVHPVPGDNHCFFHAVARQLKNTTAEALRQSVVTYLTNNPTKKIADVELQTWVSDKGGDVDTYATKMANAEWGGELELAILTEMYPDNSFYVYVLDKSKGQYVELLEFGAGRPEAVYLLFQETVPDMDGHFSVLEPKTNP